MDTIPRGAMNGFTVDMLALQSQGTPSQQHRDRNPLDLNTPILNEFLGSLIPRGSLLGNLIDPRRDIDYECGYPLNITSQQYRWFYEREGIATRVVEILPRESWALSPSIYQNDTEDETPFEAAWNKLEEDHHILSNLQSIDILSGIGYYGIMLLGLDDGLPLDQPVAGYDPVTNTMSSGRQLKLLYIRNFDESEVEITSFDNNPNSPRAGQPNSYNIRFIDTTQVNTGAVGTSTILASVHWTRVLHVADGRKSSYVFGTPRLQCVFNRIYDLRKILSGSGEMFWKGAFPGIAFEVDPTIAASINLDKEGLRKEFYEYSMGLQRYLALQGVTAKSLAPQVASPEKHFETNIKAICVSIATPYRIFMGSEEAKLASIQDLRAWNHRLARRQESYISPYIIRNFISRVMGFGILPFVESYLIFWPDLNTSTNTEKADLAFKRTQAMAQYAMTPQLASIMTPLHFYTIILDIPQDQAEAILAAAKKSDFKWPPMPTVDPNKGGLGGPNSRPGNGSSTGGIQVRGKKQRLRQ